MKANLLFSSVILTNRETYNSILSARRINQRPGYCLRLSKCFNPAPNDMVTSHRSKSSTTKAASDKSNRDEACLPRPGDCCSRNPNPGNAGCSKTKSQALYAVLNTLVADIGVERLTALLKFPISNSAGIDLNLALQIFHEEKLAVRTAVNDLWLLSGRTVVIRRSGNSSLFVDYENTLPADLKPILICDASGRVRQTYPHWSKGRGDLVTLQSGDKFYTNLTLNVWQTSGSKSGWKNNRSRTSGWNCERNQR